MAVIRLVCNLQQQNEDLAQKVDALIVSLKEHGHTVENMGDPLRRGLVGLSDEPLLEIPHSPNEGYISGDPVPIDVLLEISDVYGHDNNLGHLDYNGVIEEAARHPDKLYLVIYVTLVNPSPPKLVSTRNALFWTTPTWLGFETESINRSIQVFRDQIAAHATTTEERKEELRRIESTAESFVDSAINNLCGRDVRNRNWGTLWYGGGLVSLASGIWALIHFGLPQDVPTTLGPALGSLARSIGIVSVMAIAVKYCANLGKAFMHESLRNSDRIHAIRFGMFYLRAYGDTAKWPDVKDAFAQWNIDQPTAFADIKSSDYDPKVFELMASVMKFAGEKK